MFFNFLIIIFSFAGDLLQSFIKRKSNIKLLKEDKILCAKFSKGHFEGVLDVMNTGAACRTFNVLCAEDRRVAAALIPVA